jgi:hypothetical protein
MGSKGRSSRSKAIFLEKLPVKEWSLNGSKFSCNLCVASFKEPEELTKHLSDVHDVVPTVLPGEGIVGIQNDGPYFIVSIRMSRELYWDLVRAISRHEKTSLSELIFDAFQTLFR